MRRVLLGLGALLLIVPPLGGIVLGMLPFDGQITSSFYVVERFSFPALWTLLGGLLLLLGLLWKRP